MKNLSFIVLMLVIVAAGIYGIMQSRKAIDADAEHQALLEQARADSLEAARLVEQARADSLQRIELQRLKARGDEEAFQYNLRIGMTCMLQGGYETAANIFKHNLGLTFDNPDSISATSLVFNPASTRRDTVSLLIGYCNFKIKEAEQQQQNNNVINWFKKLNRQ